MQKSEIPQEVRISGESNLRSAYYAFYDFALAPKIPPDVY